MFIKFLSELLLINYRNADNVGMLTPSGNEQLFSIPLPPMPT